MTIQYSDTLIDDLSQVTRLYDRCYVTKTRPTDDSARIQQMLDKASFVITAWHNQQLVGLIRCFSDFTYVTYIADIAVDPNFQNQGIGKELLRLCKEKSGAGCRLSLLSNSESEAYYEKLGFKHHPRAWELYT